MMNESKKLIIPNMVLSALIATIITGIIGRLIDFKTDSFFGIVMRIITILIVFVFLYVLFFKIFLFLFKAILNRRSLPFEIKKELAELEQHEKNIETIINNSPKNLSQNTLTIYNQIKSFIDFLYKLIPDKQRNSKWEEKNIEFLRQINRERIEKLLICCESLVIDIFRIDKELIKDSNVLEKIEHLKDILSKYR